MISNQSILSVYFAIFPYILFIVTSISKLIEDLQMQIDTSAIFNICITREDLIERGIKQWKRQKKASPKNPLRVTFIGEAGIDNGAPRK